MTGWTGWVPPDGVCVCGRGLPAGGPSDWACSEECQAAWTAHQANPDYPHPRDIRDRADARLAGLHRPAPAPGPVPQGTEISVDGTRYVRVGLHWEPAGLWTPLHTGPAEAVRYQRWCPPCRNRQPSHVDGDAQVCGQCGHRWPGRPLTGLVEIRGEPWPGIRLRLTDGLRSTTATFPDQQVTSDPPLLLRCWQRLERQLGGGACDEDASEMSARRRTRAQVQLRRQWPGTRHAHMHVDLT